MSPNSEAVSRPRSVWFRSAAACGLVMVSVWACREAEPRSADPEEPTSAIGACADIGGFRPIAGFCPDPHAQILRVDSADPAALERRCREQYRDGCEEVLASGLRELSAVRYVDEHGGRAVVDVIHARLSSPEAAFSVFTQRALAVLPVDTTPSDDRAPPVDRALPNEVEPPNGPALSGEDGLSPKTVPGFAHSLLLGTVAHAWRGVDVLELHFDNPAVRHVEERAQAGSVLSAIAAVVRDTLPGKDELPTVVRLLPEEHRLPWGVRVSYRDAFGTDGAGPAALGYYAEGLQSYRIIVASYRDEASAKDVLQGVRRRPGRHDLEDVPFDAFEWSGSMGWESRSRQWLVGRFQNRVAAVGCAPEPPESTRTSRPRDWLSRTEKLQLLRRTFNRR